jgi:hypothetical protein
VGSLVRCRQCNPRPGCKPIIETPQVLVTGLDKNQSGAIKIAIPADMHGHASTTQGRYQLGFGKKKQHSPAFRTTLLTYQ